MYGSLDRRRAGDYRDVAPTSGTFDGKGPGVLSARKRLRVVDSVVDAAEAAASR